MKPSISRARAIADYLCEVRPEDWIGVTVEDAEAMVLPRFPGATFDDFAAGLLSARERLQVLYGGGGRA